MQKLQVDYKKLLPTEKQNQQKNNYNNFCKFRQKLKKILLLSNKLVN